MSRSPTLVASAQATALGCHIAITDVWKFFDRLRHPQLIQFLADRNVTLQTIAAWLAMLTNSTETATIAT